jgi:hypothetical protein
MMYPHWSLLTSCAVRYSGSNFAISQDPLTFVSVTRTLLVVKTGSGLSLLVVV